MRLVGVLLSLFAISCFSEHGGQDGGGDGSDASGGGSSGSGSSSAGTSATTTATSTAADSGSASSETSDTAPTTGEECPGGSVPAPPIVAGWDGPYVLLPGDAPACPPELAGDTPAIVAVEPVPAPCECGCLGSCDVEFFDAGDESCSSAIGNMGVFDFECYDLETSSKARSSQMPGDNDCSSPTATPPLVSYDGSHRVCAGVEGSCVPVPGGAVGPCLRKPGIAEGCSIPGLPRMIVTMTEATITCPTCDTCLPALGEACASAEVTLYSESGCFGETSNIGEFCSLNPGVSVLLDFELMCPATGGVMPQPTDPVSYCCPE